MEMTGLQLRNPAIEALKVQKTRWKRSTPSVWWSDAKSTTVLGLDAYKTLMNRLRSANDSSLHDLRIHQLYMWTNAHYNDMERTHSIDLEPYKIFWHMLTSKKYMIICFFTTKMHIYHCSCRNCNPPVGATVSNPGVHWTKLGLTVILCSRLLNLVESTSESNIWVKFGTMCKMYSR